MNDTDALVVENIVQADRMVLEKFAKQGVVEITEPVVDPSGHGEFLTAGVVIGLSLAGLKALSAWLNKRRTEETFTITGDIRKQDGSEQNITISWTRKDSEAAEPEQLKALAKLLDVDLSALPS
jgi:hypothetical protein